MGMERAVSFGMRVWLRPKPSNVMLNVFLEQALANGAGSVVDRINSTLRLKEKIRPLEQLRREKR